MNESITSIATVTFTNGSGEPLSDSVCATVEIVDAEHESNVGHLENIASNHK